MTGLTLSTSEPIAYFLTWSSYGTWLPGDERGSWHQGKWIPPSGLFREMARMEMKEAPFTLSGNDPDTVEATVARHCAIRGWLHHAVKARTNHVHVIVTASEYLPETVRDQLKAWCTRTLKPSYPGRKRFWTEGGSCRWINRTDDLIAAIQYVNEAQNRKDRDP